MTGYSYTLDNGQTGTVVAPDIGAAVGLVADIAAASGAKFYDVSAGAPATTVVDAAGGS